MESTTNKQNSKISRELVFARLYKEYVNSANEDSEQLKRLMRALHDNYSEQTESDVLQSTTDILAKATLQELEQERKGNRIKKLGVFMPIITIVLTFIFIIWFGRIYEERSFNRNVVFKAQLERFQTAESLITEIGFDLRDVAYRVGWDTSHDSESTRYISFVQEQREELERLENILRGFPEDSRERINEALLACMRNIDLYLSGKDKLDYQYAYKLKEEISEAYIGFLDRQTL